jgi:hypothetical protein
MKILLPFLLVFGFFSLNAQKVGWLSTAGNDDYESSSTLATDSAGNSFFGGSFRDSITFDSITFFSPDYRYYLAKYDKDGEFLWVDTGVTGTRTSKCEEVALDKFGHLYAFGEGDSIYINANKKGISTGTFLAQYDQKGDINWKVDLPQKFDGKDIATGPNGNLYLGGIIKGQVVLGNDTFKQKGSFSDAFIIEYDSLGNYKNAIQGKSSGISSLIRAVTVDKNGSLYSGGDFDDTLYFGSKSVYFDNNTPFVAKHGPSGSIKWIKFFKGPNRGFGYCNEIIVNQNREILAAGHFKDSIQIGNKKLQGNSSDNSFVAKLSSNGSILWSDWIGVVSKTKTGSVSNYGISSSNGFFYLCGSLGASKNNIPFGFGTDTVRIKGRNNSFSPFITKIAPDGQFLWTFTSEQEYFGTIRGVGNDQTGNAYFTGFYSDTLTF